MVRSVLVEIATVVVRAAAAVAMKWATGHLQQ